MFNQCLWYERHIWNLEFEIWDASRASQITKVFVIHCMKMILSPAHFYNCDAEILKTDIERQEINPGSRCHCFQCLSFSWILNVPITRLQIYLINIKQLWKARKQRTSCIRGTYSDKKIKCVSYIKGAVFNVSVSILRNHVCTRII